MRIKKIQKIPIRKTDEILGLFFDYLIVELNKSWHIENQKIPQGSIVAIDKRIAGKRNISKKQINLLYTPDKTSSIFDIAITKDRILINILKNVKGKILQVTANSNGFLPAKPMPLIKDAHLLLAATDVNASDFFVLHYDFLLPDTLYFHDNSKSKISKIKALPARFNSQEMVTIQKWATSKDGTQIPYFLVGKKSQIKKGNAPVLLYGYGGFRSSLTPSYSPFLGRVWLEKGGLYALANIRGGGEFGPHWHESAKKMNRHKAFDDFIAVAQDLIKSKITHKNKLAIMGGSNGGLLVGTVMMQRPDLFRAVICQAPLLDMIRYPKLLAGASWVAEYGHPDNKKIRKYLLSYSPYHNIKKEESYPDLLLLTSTNDDRVHPGHARKMAAKMQNMGHENVYYYENIEGGHGGSANLKQSAKIESLIYEFLFKTVLIDKNT